jgi:hypothetical protein
VIWDESAERDLENNRFHPCNLLVCFYGLHTDIQFNDAVLSIIGLCRPNDNIGHLCLCLKTFFSSFYIQRWPGRIRLLCLDKTMKEYTMDRTTYLKILNHRGLNPDLLSCPFCGKSIDLLLCHFCQKPIHIGDRVVSKKSTKCHILHAHCGNKRYNGSRI